MEEFGFSHNQFIKNKHQNVYANNLKRYKTSTTFWKKITKMVKLIQLFPSPHLE